MRSRRLAMAAFGIVLVTWLAATWLALLSPTPSASASWGIDGALANLLFPLAMFMFPVVGILIAWHEESNPIAWLLLGIGFVWALSGVTTGYTTYALKTHPGSVPGGAVVAAIDGSLWVPAIGLMGIFLVILFPTGHLPTARARIIARVGAIAIVLGSVSILFAVGPMDDSSAPAGVVNPIGIRFLRPLLDPLRLIVILIPLCIVGAAGVLVGRLRRSTGVERLQLKWFAYAAALVALTYLVAMACSTPYSIVGHAQPGWVGFIQEIAIFSFVLIPIAIGISVLRYRLYDIDVVISKTVVFGALAAFITVVYVAIVVGIGSLFGSGDRANPALAIAATVVVALAFQPVRDRVHRFANRLVYGERATPYEVMSDLGHRMAGAIDVGRALPEMAEVAARGIRAQVAKVDLRMPKGDGQTVTWPPDAVLPQEWTRTVEVRYQGEPIGEISVLKAVGDPILPTESALLEDLASQAGLAMHNVRLTDELKLSLDELAAQANDLEASRRRLVTARDTQRRQLEREISEGPRRGLEAIGARLVDLEGPRAPGAERTAQELEDLGGSANAVLEALRDLARGIFPPLLAEKGAVAALDAHIRKVGAHVSVLADAEVTGRRFDAEVEACVYFCGVQAIQNVIRHADNVPAVLRLHLDQDTLSFELTDEGRGFSTDSGPQGRGLQTMRDRLQALGGELSIESQPGVGTTVTGRLPVDISSPAAALKRN